MDLERNKMCLVRNKGRGGNFLVNGTVYVILCHITSPHVMALNITFLCTIWNLQLCLELKMGLIFVQISSYYYSSFPRLRKYSCFNAAILPPLNFIQEIQSCTSGDSLLPVSDGICYSSLAISKGIYQCMYQYNVFACFA